MTIASIKVTFAHFKKWPFLSLFNLYQFFLTFVLTDYTYTTYYTYYILYIDLRSVPTICFKIFILLRVLISANKFLI